MCYGVLGNCVCPIVQSQRLIGGQWRQWILPLPLRGNEKGEGRGGKVPRYLSALCVFIFICLGCVLEFDVTVD